MEQLETIAFLQQRYATTMTQVESFAGTHRTLLHVVGVVTAVTLGGVGGLWLAKGALAAKAAPLAVGLVSGTLAGVGFMYYQVQRMQDELAAQDAQLDLVQAEHERLVRLLAKTEVINS